MGLKIRAGLAFGGLIMSYFFGLSGLSGIASHLDSTGNILVDIADGVGLVSKVSSLFFRAGSCIFFFGAGRVLAGPLNLKRVGSRVLKNLLWSSFSSKYHTNRS